MLCSVSYSASRRAAAPRVLFRYRAMRIPWRALGAILGGRGKPHHYAVATFWLNNIEKDQERLFKMLDAYHAYKKALAASATGDVPFPSFSIHHESIEVRRAPRKTGNLPAYSAKHEKHEADLPSALRLSLRLRLEEEVGAPSLPAVQSSSLRKLGAHSLPPSSFILHPSGKLGNTFDLLSAGAIAWRPPPPEMMGTPRLGGTIFMVSPSCPLHGAPAALRQRASPGFPCAAPFFHGPSP